MPVLQLEDGTIIDESLDIMTWAFSTSEQAKKTYTNLKILKLIEKNDNEFKYFLDRYKYSDRYPEHDFEFYREQSKPFLHELESILSQFSHVLGEKCSFSDMAISPFVRQFYNVDSDWFENSEFSKTKSWLKKNIESMEFKSIMKKWD